MLPVPNKVCEPIVIRAHFSYHAADIVEGIWHGGKLSMNDFLVIGNISDDPFAIDIGHLCGQINDMSDLISLKTLLYFG
jgi:hypothetical protein